MRPSSAWRWYAGLPLWAAWLASMLLLAAGLMGIVLCEGFFAFGEDTDKGLVAAWRDRPWVVATAVVVIPLLQALFWQALFIDGLGRLTPARWPWVPVSALLFGIGAHWGSPGVAMLTSTWFGLVCSLAYLAQRRHSFQRALAVAAGVQVAFVAAAVALALLEA